MLNTSLSRFHSGTIASIVYRKGNRCAHVYTTDYGWARAFLMTSRNEAHETLSMIFTWDSVPPPCICVNTKEMIQGIFYPKLKYAACQLKQLEPYTPWLNIAEREMTRKGLDVSCCSQMHQSTYGRTDQSWKPTFGPILPMRFINLMRRLQQQ